jgi:hypothetical protein
MSEFILEETGLDTEQVGGFDESNIKRLRSGDGSFQIENGALKLRDSSGNVVVIIDANG